MEDDVEAAIGKDGQLVHEALPRDERQAVATRDHLILGELLRRGVEHHHPAARRRQDRTLLAAARRQP